MPPYESLPDDFFPPDAVAARLAIGIVPYYLRSLPFVDFFGLVDRTVARGPVPATNAGRQIAHDRRPPPGYLARRGVNLTMHGAWVSESPLGRPAGRYAVRAGPRLWVTFDSVDHEWVMAAFADREVHVRDPQRLQPR